MKLYLAGPMRGYTDLNFPEFDTWAQRLRAVDYDVFNPAEQDRDFLTGNGREPAIRECLRLDLDWICDHADGIAWMDGSTQSKGAQAEMALGHALLIPVRHAKDWFYDKY